MVVAASPGRRQVWSLILNQGQLRKEREAASSVECDPFLTLFPHILALSMAMATMATSLITNAHLAHLPTAPGSRTSASSRSLVALSAGRNASTAWTSKSSTLRSNQSRRLSVKAMAVIEVDISKIVPQADRVLVRLEKLADQSSGGVLLPPASVKYERYLVGEVIAAGTEVENIEKGQKVMFSDMSALEVNFGTDDRLCFCRCDDLLAVVQ